MRFHYSRKIKGEPTISEVTRQFNDLDGLYKIAHDQPDPERHDILAKHDEKDGFDQVHFRDALYVEDNFVGDVSSNADWYNVIPFRQVLDEVAQKIDREDLDPYGDFSRRDNHSKMSARIYLDNPETTIEPSEGDTTQLGINLSAGHTGFTGIRYDLGGIREICSNGMKGWVTDMKLYQDHTEEFRPELPHHAIDALIEGADNYEQRLKDAQNQELMNLDEALILLQETGVGEYLENPTADLINAAHDEIEDRNSPTVYEAFQTGTRALEHYSDAEHTEKQRGYDQVSQLLDQNGEMPAIEEYARDVVNDRVDHLVENQDAEEYWDGEWDSVQELVAARN